MSHKVKIKLSRGHKPSVKIDGIEMNDMLKGIGFDTGGSLWKTIPKGGGEQRPPECILTLKITDFTLESDFDNQKDNKSTK